MAKILDSIRQDMEASIKAYNEALLVNNYAKMQEAEAALKDSESKYIEQRTNEVFSECKKADNPILEAAKRHSFTVLGHKTLREDGAMKGFELAEKTRQIDMVKLAKYLNLGHVFEYRVEKFGNLLCMRAAKELGLRAAEVKKIERLYYCNSLSRKEELGAVPTSNNQVVKLLQKVIDTLLFVEGSNGGNIYRCNNHDVAYLLMCYTKRNRKALTIEVARNRFVASLIADVMHRIVTGGMYDLKYQMVKEKAEKPATAEVQKPESPEVSDEDTIAIERPAPEFSAPDTDEDELPSLDELPNLNA